MNIHQTLSPSTFVQSSRNSPKLYSPSYTTTTRTLSSSCTKPSNCLMEPHVNQSCQNHAKKGQQVGDSTKVTSKASQTQNGPFVVIDNIKWDNCQGFFTSEMELRVQYSVLKQLEENITWKVVYLGSAFSQSYDQTLTEFETEQSDPSSSYPQKRQFKLTVQPPKWNLICPGEFFNITAIVISAFYKKQQFVKVGYYVHYQLPALTKQERNLLSLMENMDVREDKQDNVKKSHKTKKITKKSPKDQSSRSERVIEDSEQKVLDRMLQRTVRTILGDKPRVTKFEIDWLKQNIVQESGKQQNKSQCSIKLQNQRLITQFTRTL